MLTVYEFVFVDTDWKMLVSFLILQFWLRRVEKTSNAWPKTAAFVAIHLFGNLKVFQGAEQFNGYAAWLREAFYPLLPKEFVLKRELLLAALWRAPETWIRLVRSLHGQSN